MTIGRALDEVLQISEESIVSALDGLLPKKMHCSNLAQSAGGESCEAFNCSVTTREHPMSILEELRQAALLQHEEGDLPEWLLADILGVADHPDRYADREQLVQQLIEQVRGYDAYAGTGCFSASFGLEDIRRTMRQLLP